MISDATTVSKSIYHTLNCCVRAELQTVRDEALVVIYQVSRQSIKESQNNQCLNSDSNSVPHTERMTGVRYTLELFSCMNRKHKLFMKGTS
jgi:hypothetical protein